MAENVGDEMKHLYLSFQEVEFLLVVDHGEILVIVHCGVVEVILFVVDLGVLL